jgi:hypothetical protein
MARTFKILILIFPVLLFPALLPASAWELKTGRLTNIETLVDCVRLTIKRSANSTSGNPAKTLMTIEIPETELPEELKKGDLIRIWSNTKAQKTVFRITPLRGYDPTGVRSRLQRRGHRFAGGHGGKGGNGGH